VAGPDEVEEVREDALLRGRVPLRQPRDGYRVNVDALWLAAFARSSAKSRPVRHAIDLGAGVGAIGLVLAATDAASRVTLLDVDPALCGLAIENAAAASLDARVDVVCADLEAALPRALFGRHDLVVANPPYAVDEAARRSPDPRRARARTGAASTLRAFAKAARVALGAAGRACFVYPAADLPRLLETLRGVGLEPKRLRMVHPLPDRAARVALVEAKPARHGGLRVEPPLLAMRAPGAWTDEAAAILERGFAG
jgi:tRNA1Val (adenine37-N6)-methyltransferase